MHPYHHALSSVQAFGGDLDRHYSLHAFLDQSKAFVPWWLHRMFLHHEQGVGWASLYAQRSLGMDDETARAIARRHVEEDCGFVPTFGRWLTDLVGEHSLEGFPCMPGTLCKSLDWLGDQAPALAGLLREPSDDIASAKSSRVDPLWGFACLCHEPGLFWAERVLGPLAENGEPARVLGEKFLLKVFGKLPALTLWTDRLREGAGGFHPKGWMLRVAKKSAQVLEEAAT